MPPKKQEWVPHPDQPDAFIKKPPEFTTQVVADAQYSNGSPDFGRNKNSKLTKFKFTVYKASLDGNEEYVGLPPTHRLKDSFSPTPEEYLVDMSVEDTYNLAKGLVALIENHGEVVDLPLIEEEAML